ncbi:predicted protein [Nematostella vectensis]|uniref:Uncharacterized protein n=1 Tax=Nematostella vectensis TaxID=45351 RepID=A7SLW6_NEMVE|nr:predicted protein [Nematostella vectensis]|eukprot:XP_001627409.1 predicted protein [Nematostella vectensis]
MIPQVKKTQKRPDDGEGMYQYDNGDFYVGEWRRGKRHGYGNLEKADEGMYQYDNGDFYVGEWRRGKRHGYGNLEKADASYTHDNGDTYTGQWQAGMRHGKGELVTADGRRIEGYWRNDEYVGTEPPP